MFRIKLAPTIELKVEYDWIQSENIILWALIVKDEFPQALIASKHSKMLRMSFPCENTKK